MRARKMKILINWTKGFTDNFTLVKKGVWSKRAVYSTKKKNLKLKGFQWKANKFLKTFGCWIFFLNFISKLKYTWKL